MKIDNPPSPPFRKGGVGGFESYFLGGNNLKKGARRYGVGNYRLETLQGIRENAEGNGPALGFLL
jgi:hypothetical protein